MAPEQSQQQQPGASYQGNSIIFQTCKIRNCSWRPEVSFVLLRGISSHSPAWSPNHNFSISASQNFVLKVFPMILVQSAHYLAPIQETGTNPFTIALKKPRCLSFREIHFTTRLVLMSNGCLPFASRPLFPLVLLSVFDFWGKDRQH